MASKPKDPTVLESAIAATTGERMRAYGAAGAHLEMVAQQWSLFILQKYGFDIMLTGEDVAWFMADFKKVRQMRKHKRDNLVDAAGYIGLIEETIIRAD